MSPEEKNMGFPRENHVVDPTQALRDHLPPLVLFQEHLLHGLIEIFSAIKEGHLSFDVGFLNLQPVLVPGQVIVSEFGRKLFEGRLAQSNVTILVDAVLVLVAIDCLLWIVWHGAQM